MTREETNRSDNTILGVDTGGTFTDFVLYQNNEIRTHKVLSTPEAPEQAILNGIKELGLTSDTPSLRIIHGTTVATNAALESSGVKTAFITNKGFRDLLTIGRQARKELYNLTPSYQPPPVPKGLCLEVDCRRDAKGEVVAPLSKDDIETLLRQLDALKPAAVAICLLFSFLDSSDEKRIEEAIINRFGEQIFVSRSSWVLPQYKEYERGIATWYNAYLSPLVNQYLSRLQMQVSPAPLAIMQSSGITMNAKQASRRAVNLLLSGPAGGLSAVKHIGELIGKDKILSFDMGGTSTDVSLIDGVIKLTDEGRIGDFPVAVPMIDMNTIGAGGGSIAYADNSGMLHVGPQSAGASPGPACYGLGGNQATVTDANALLGRLQPDYFLGGGMALDLKSAEQVIKALATRMNLSPQEAALGILDLANEHMVQALRLISEQRGHDPKDYTLCGFGGAGGLHICELADALGIRAAVVPAMGGVLSAFGMLVAPAGREISRAFLGMLSELPKSAIDKQFDALEAQAISELVDEGHQKNRIHIRRSIDSRYQGQSFSLNTDWLGCDKSSDLFHAAHRKAYGHDFDLPIELVNLRLSARVKSEPLARNLPSTSSLTNEAKYRDIWVRRDNGEVYKAQMPLVLRENIARNHSFTGPSLLCEQASTIWVAPNWQFEIDKFGNVLLSKTE